MHRRIVSGVAIAAMLAGSSTTAVASELPPSSSPVRAHGVVVWATPAASPLRPGKAEWEKIEAAARLRRMALARHRSAYFREFTASLGLGELVSLHRLAPGRCATAVSYLYDNLLDLENAYPGENWAPLRRAVAQEPSIQVCAPRRGRTSS